MLLLAVPEAVSSHTKVRSRSAVQSILSLAPRCPRGSLVPYKSKEHQFCGAFLTERTVCGMGLAPSREPYYISLGTDFIIHFLTGLHGIDQPRLTEISVPCCRTKFGHFPEPRRNQSIIMQVKICPNKAKAISAKLLEFKLKIQL